MNQPKTLFTNWLKTRTPWLIFAALVLLALVYQGTRSDSVGNTDTGEATRYSVVYYDVFDTVTTLIAYCDSEEEFAALSQGFYDDLLEYHQLYDIYNSYDGIVNLKTVNETAAIAPVEVDQKIMDLLAEAKELYALSDGNVNIAMGSVLSLWHDARSAATADPDSAALPDADALAEAALHTNLDDVILDFENNTVYFADPDIQLDVGSCGKGYACEMAAQNAEASGLASALIGVGGNLRGIGTKPDGTSWVGGIENPWEMASLGYSASYLATVNVSELALVVSGDYQRYYDVDGVRYHHLIDPETNMPATYFNSVSVVCADSGLADCLSTALFCMNLADGQALVESLEGVEALWCMTDGETLIRSSGFAAYESTS